MSFPASPDGLDIDTPHMMCILRVVPRNSPKDTPFPVYKQLATISFFLPFNPDRLLDSLDIILALWETSTDRAKSALTCSSRDVTLMLSCISLYNLTTLSLTLGSGGSYHH